MSQATNEASRVNQLQRDAADTRARVAEEIDELSSRLSAESIKQAAKGAVIGAKNVAIAKVRDKAEHAYDHARDMGEHALGAARANPVPLVLIGVGVGWLLLSRHRPRSGNGSEDANSRDAGSEYSAVESYPPATRRRSAYEPMTQFEPPDAAQPEHTSMSRRARAAGKRSVEYGRRGRRFAEDKLQTNPLAVGAAAVAAGVVVGLLIPGTRKEDGWMGDARDQLLERGREQVERASHVLSDKAHEVTDDVAAKRHQRANGPDPRAPHAAARGMTRPATGGA